MAWRVGAARDLRIVSRSSWDGPAAAKRIFAWAGFDDDSPQPERARRGFLIYNDEDPTLRGNYKLPFADVVDGELVAVDAGLRAAASRLPQTDAPEEVLRRARTVLDGYFERMGNERAGRVVLTAKGPARIYTKAYPAESVVEDDDSRVVVGYASVFGVVDDADDVLHPGAFAKTIRERADRIRYLWQHDFLSPPVAVIEEVAEVGADDLPDQVRERHPEATGGLRVVRRYLETPRGDEILVGIRSGAIREMSFGFDILNGKRRKGRGMDITEVRLWEISDVNWGMNPATVASVRSAIYNAVPYVAAASGLSEDEVLRKAQEFLGLCAGPDACVKAEEEPATVERVRVAEWVRLLETMLELP